MDWTPVFQAVIGIVAATLTAFGVPVLMKLAGRFGVQLDQAQAQQLEQMAQKALSFGAMQATDTIKAKGWDHVETHNAVLDAGLGYFIGHFPDKAKEIAKQITGTDSLTANASLAAIRDVLKRALPTGLAVAAASPATPPATAPTPATMAELPKTEAAVQSGDTPRRSVAPAAAAPAADPKPSPPPAPATAKPPAKPAASKSRKSTVKGS
jgi:hypothetical protein